MRPLAAKAGQPLAPPHRDVNGVLAPVNRPRAMNDVRPGCGLGPLATGAGARPSVRANLCERELASLLARPGAPTPARLDPPNLLPRIQDPWLGDSKSRRNSRNLAPQEHSDISASAASQRLSKIALPAMTLAARAGPRAPPFASARRRRAPRSRDAADAEISRKWIFVRDPRFDAACLEPTANHRDRAQRSSRTAVPYASTSVAPATNSVAS
jgi:hypothetical protein